MLKDFLSKSPFNEPFLDLNDRRWNLLEGGYRGIRYDTSIALKALEQADTIQKVNSIYDELWNGLHHQGDVGLASYYAVPHLVRIAGQTQVTDWNLFGLVSTIEIQRHKNNPTLPKALEPGYQDAISSLADIAVATMKPDSKLNLIINALSVIAIAKNQLKLAEVIAWFGNEEEMEDFLNS